MGWENRQTGRLAVCLLMTFFHSWVRQFLGQGLAWFGHASAPPTYSGIHVRHPSCVVLFLM